MQNNSNKLLVTMFAGLASLIVLTCVCTALLFAGVDFLLQRAARPEASLPIPTAAESTITAAPIAEPATATMLPDDFSTPTTNPTSSGGPPAGGKPGHEDAASNDSIAPPSPQENLAAIQNTLVPVNDLVDLANRLSAAPIGLFTPPPSPPDLQLGARQAFWVMDTDENRNFQITASLVNVSDHLYFWVENGLSVNQRAIKRLADAFDQKIYPTNRAFFGSEWTPGIDGDPRLYILIASNLGNGIAGYFSSADEYPPEINEYSNAHEMFVINADTTRLSDEYTYGVLAHEFQHMIHWYQDRNEETWMNEGFSDLAHFLNGYEVGGADLLYLSNPDIQLNDWPDEPDPVHYGASFLFLTYFLDRFGEKATQALVADPANGLASIDQVLAGGNAQDGITGQPIGADDVFIDWAVTNYLQDGRVSDGRYTYRNYPEAPKAGPTEILADCPTGPQPRQVHQYGVDYIRIRCPGEYRLQFQSPAEVDLLPTEPQSGLYAFWSNRGDESDMTLTSAFDFRDVSGPLTLNYWTWYDIEKGFDFVYLLVSTDHGQSWNILNTPSGSFEDLSGNSFGQAYTGQSGAGVPGWSQESVDISELAGKEVLIRFEYVTDASVNGEGFLLDDIAIPQIDYTTDFEKDAGGWEPQGFVRVLKSLPQTFRLALIEKGQLPQISLYTLDGDNSLEIPIQIGKDYKEVILVVSGTTRITRQEADYSFQLIR
jgi:immune inhibitor A